MTKARKGCEIYQTATHYIIGTLYRQPSWAYLLSDPFYTLPRTASAALATSILEALQTSRQLKAAEEDIFWKGENALLEQFQTESYEDFYKESKLWTLWWTPPKFWRTGRLEIHPQVYRGFQQGWQPVDEKKITLSYSKEEEQTTMKQAIALLEEH